ncbi:MAG: IclR family transcriptional regulator [Phycisphaerales bacterium]|nr:MAG: IclR family transcriptional regulator [Phycisphaerales bacterium]
MDKYQIPNLAKACRALSWLAAERGAYSASEVARKLQMPRTTAFRVLRTLCAEGLVEEADGRYRAGAGLLRLGLLALQTVEIHSLAEPVLQRLARATGETAHLAVRTGDQMLILQVADSPNPIRVASRPGTLVLIHCAATGKALLAALPPARARAILRGRPLQRRTDRTITTVAALETELEATRRQGYAVDDEEYHVGVRCLAAPVFDARGDVVAALGITAATLRFAKRKIPVVAREVTRAAESLSDALGQRLTGRTA